MGRIANLALRAARALRSEVVSRGYIRRFLLLDLFGYGARQTAKALGTRAGGPEVAATCDTANALHVFDPELAELVDDPERLMKPVGERPEPRRPFVHIDQTYPELVEKAVASGLQEWGEATEAVHSGDRPQHSGAFAVAKDDKEDRWISPLEFANDCVDDARLPPLVAPYIPQLATTTLRPRCKLRVSKRDARHYFHVLRRGRKWRKWMAMPPVRKAQSRRPTGASGLPLEESAVDSWIRQLVLTRCFYRVRCSSGRPCSRNIGAVALQ